MAAQGLAQDGEKSAVDKCTALAGPPMAMRELQGEGRTSGEEGGMEGEQRAQGGETTPTSSLETSPSSSPSLPTFPTELISLILASPCLRNRDLARSACVSHTFLAVARPLLYNVLTFPFLAHDHDGFMLSPSTSGLLDTLTEHPHLASLARELTVKIEGVDDDRILWLFRQSADEFFVGPDWRDWFELSESSDWHDWLQSEGADPQRTLDWLFKAIAPHLLYLDVEEDGNCLDVHTVFRLHTFPALTELRTSAFVPFVASKFPALTTLECYESYRTESHLEGVEPPPPPPFALNTLLFSGDRHDEEVLLAYLTWLTSTSLTSLTELEISYDHATFPLIPLFTSLRSLRFREFTLPDWQPDFDTFPDLPPFLEFLEITVEGPPHRKTKLDHTPLVSLPPSIIRLALDFHLFRPSVLAELVRRGILPKLEQLTLLTGVFYPERSSQAVERSWQPSGIMELRRACGERGVELEPYARSIEDLKVDRGE